MTSREKSNPDACCGSGGSYVVSHYETSSSIGRKKVEDFNRTDAGVVATGCPACMLKLLANLNRFGKGDEPRIIFHCRRSLAG